LQSGLCQQKNANQRNQFSKSKLTGAGELLEQQQQQQ